MFLKRPKMGFTEFLEKQKQKYKYKYIFYSPKLDEYILVKEVYLLKDNGKKYVLYSDGKKWGKKMLLSVGAKKEYQYLRKL